MKVDHRKMFQPQNFRRREYWLSAEASAQKFWIWSRFEYLAKIRGEISKQHLAHFTKIRLRSKKIQYIWQAAGQPG